MNISNIVDKYRKEINQLLIEIYPKGPKSLIKPINYVLQGKGKRLRPILAIFSAEACGSKKDDVILPEKCTINVSVGDKVSGCRTILGEFNE